MHEDFWHQRWAEGRTGWHQAEVDRLLQKHWPVLGLATGTRVLVPLCGKSLDLAWLAARGHAVAGIELSLSACAAFFAERGLAPAHGTRDGFRVLTSAGIELWCGDAFALRGESVADVAGVYDRAALIALPPAMRTRYVGSVYAALPTGTRGLLITLEYPQAERAGPPFSVPENEVHDLFEPDWEIECLERRDILESESGIRVDGVSALHTAVYRLARV